MAWVKDGDLTRCTDHDERFDPSERTCAACQRDPGPEITDEIDAPLPDPPSGCLDSDGVERWFTTIAETSRRFARRLANSGAESSDIAKHREVAIKAMRAAAEFVRQREDAALVKAREKRIRDRMLGVAR